MTNEELDKATADEAWRILEEGQDVAVIAARLAREGYRPPEPVDPDVLAYREWAERNDRATHKDAYFAGARMAREQEQERAKVLVKGIGEMRRRAPYLFGDIARDTLAAYKAGKAAR
jgi:hypothetical protein